MKTHIDGAFNLIHWFILHPLNLSDLSTWQYDMSNLVITFEFEEKKLF